MSWKLWIDDQITDMTAPDRWTPIGDEWYGAADVEHAKWLVETYGFPEFIDFDHDLGMDEEGKDLTVKPFVKWLGERAFDENGVLRPPPGWRVHSANPPGAAWIESEMRSWQKVANGEV